MIFGFLIFTARIVYWQAKKGEPPGLSVFHPRRTRSNIEESISGDGLSSAILSMRRNGRKLTGKRGQE